jgi:hypothetical protein
VEDAKPPNCFLMVTSFLCRLGLWFPAGNRYPHLRDYRIPPAYDAHRAHADETYPADGTRQAYDSRGHIHQSQRSTYGRASGLQHGAADAHNGDCWSFMDHHRDRETNDDEVSYALMGGGIKSPSNVERCKQARQQGMSHYDAAALADKDYHGSVWGFDPLTIEIIKNCGYMAINSDDIILCYRDIMLLHCKTLEGWTNIRTQQSGPSVEQIMEKAMTLFEKLESITTTDLVHFYVTFQKTGSVYLLPFMPFDAVSLKLGFEGLFPPGLGIDRYAVIAAAVMEVIPRLLPAHIARLSTVIAMVRAD